MASKNINKEKKKHDIHQLLWQRVKSYGFNFQDNLRLEMWVRLLFSCSVFIPN